MSMKESPPRPLPRLRANLQVLESTPAPDGQPVWTIVDPVRNRYFQIGWTAHQLLERWACGSIDRVIHSVQSETTCRVTEQDVQDLITFLFVNNLTEETPSGGSRDYAVQAEARRQGWGAWLLHHYLFVRIPLVRPERFLRATLPLVAPLFTGGAAWLVLLLAVSGLYLVSRQWDTFVSTFPTFFTFQGAMLSAAALAGIKVLHELGHAYTATKYGCRVQTMGVALLVLFPVLYSDTTEAWRLTSRRQRLAIGAAGMVVELALAAVATFVWNFLPDGTARTLAFVVATASWVIGLSINLNPLMRFDGYYLLADWLGVPNLQDRAFAFGRWTLRELLFAPGEAAPEIVPPALRRTLLLYAWATWLYRFGLFLGIAMLVYSFFFKALGVILFAVEILWFILLPIGREVHGWWQERSTLAVGSRFWVTTLVSLTLLVLMVVPWPTQVSLQAVVQATSYATLYAPIPARVRAVMVRNGQRVQAGDILLTLESPELERDMRRTQIQIEALEVRAGRQASSETDRMQRQVVVESLHSRKAELRGLLEKREHLILRAPITGMVTDCAESLHPGRWVNEKLALAYVIGLEQAGIDAVAPEGELAYLEPGQLARFVPKDLTRDALSARVREIRQIDDSTFALPYYASVYGGNIATRKDPQGRVRPDASIFRVHVQLLEDGPDWNQAVTGTLQVEGRHWSVAERVWDRMVAVLARESGF